MCQLDNYYRQKPLVVALRFVEVSASLARFVLSVLADVLTNNWDKNMKIRAVQMREFTSSNGPAFIKVRAGRWYGRSYIDSPIVVSISDIRDTINRTTGNFNSSSPCSSNADRVAYTRLGPHAQRRNSLSFNNKRIRQVPIP